jgi:hypothetical protein
MKIELEIDIKDNEATESPYWLILDPKQNMNCDIHQLAGQITGPFFSRESAENHLKSRRYNYTKRAHVYCLSGYYSFDYKMALRQAKLNINSEGEK